MGKKLKRKPAKKAPTKKTKSQPWYKPRFGGQNVCIVGKTTGYYLELEDYQQLVAEEGGTLTELGPDLNVLIVLEKGATAAARKQAEKLNQQGATISILSEDEVEESFVPTSEEILELIAAGEPGTNRYSDLMEKCRHQTRYLTIDLTGENLRHRNLRGMEMSSLLLNRADLRDTDLYNAELGELSDARLDGTNATHLGATSLKNCSLKKAKLDHFHLGTSRFGPSKELDQCCFDGSDLTEAYFSYGDLRDSSFKKCSAQKVKFNYAKLSGIDFTGADLTEAELSSIQCSQDISFRNAKLCGACLEQSDLSATDFSRADLSNANLAHCDFTGANLKGANFRGANVIGCNFTNTNASEAKNLELPAANQVQTGQSCKAIDKAAQQADAVTISATVTLADCKVDFDVDTEYLGASRPSIAYMIRRTKGRKEELADQVRVETKSMLHAFQSVGQWFGHGQLDFESIRASSSRCTLKGKQLKATAQQALAEIFATEVPSEADAKASRKKARNTKAAFKEEVLAELRGGAKGIKLFNDRDHRAMARSKRNQFRKEDFRKQKFDKIAASSLDFQNCDFSEATIRNGELSYSNCNQSKFVNADIRKSKLHSSRFNDCDFQGAILADTNLSFATLQRSNLTSVDLSRANLYGADLRDANMKDAVLTGADLPAAVFSTGTIFPDGFEIPVDMEFDQVGQDPRNTQPLPSPNEVGDFDAFLERLTGTIDNSRLKKALKMLKADRFQLFSEVNDSSFAGVVKSQTDDSLVYACRLQSDGGFCCCTQNLNPCGGLRGALCKHLLVLLIGLTKANELGAGLAALWASASTSRKPQHDRDAMSEVLLRYKGAEAGEIDWRPVETVPEDFYAL